MRTFVINLDRRTDRLVEITATLAKLGIPFERVSAVDARAIDTSNLVEWKRAYIYNNFQPPVIGQIGVYHSHRIVWQKMIDQDIGQALIFEDDAVA